MMYLLRRGEHSFSQPGGRKGMEGRSKTTFRLLSNRLSLRLTAHKPVDEIAGAHRRLHSAVQRGLFIPSASDGLMVYALR